MSKETKGPGFTRREFVKTVGLAGLAVAGAGVPGVMAAPESETGAKTGTMPRRVLGKTGVECSILNLGGMFDTINNQLLLKQAMKWGVTYWDTAEAYGNGLSEDGFGRYLRPQPRGPQGDLHRHQACPAEGGNLTQRLEKSLNRLQTDHVDLFFIHAITGINEMTPAFKDWAAEMKKAGKIQISSASAPTPTWRTAWRARPDWTGSTP